MVSEIGRNSTVFRYVQFHAYDKRVAKSDRKRKNFRSYISAAVVLRSRFVRVQFRDYCTRTNRKVKKGMLLEPAARIGIHLGSEQALAPVRYPDTQTYKIAINGSIYSTNIRLCLYHQAEGACSEPRIHPQW